MSRRPAAVALAAGALAALAASGCARIPDTHGGSPAPSRPPVAPYAVETEGATPCQLYAAWRRGGVLPAITAALGEIARAARPPVDAGTLQLAGGDLSDAAAAGAGAPPPPLRGYVAWERGMTLLQAAGDEIEAGSATWQAASAALQAGGLQVQRAEALDYQACNG